MAYFLLYLWFLQACPYRYSQPKAAAPTCTETGLTEGSHCSVCGEVIVAQEVVPALGHDFGEWTAVKEPTYFAKGLEERVCSRCGETEQRMTDKIPVPENTDDIICGLCGIEALYDIPYAGSALMLLHRVIHVLISFFCSFQHLTK